MSFRFYTSKVLRLQVRCDPRVDPSQSVVFCWDPTSNFHLAALKRLDSVSGLTW